MADDHPDLRVGDPRFYRRYVVLARVWMVLPLRLYRARAAVAVPAGHHLSMNLMQFHRIRTALQVNASPGRGRDLETVERMLRRRLVESGLFERVEVGHTDDPDRLVIALCRFGPFRSGIDVATSLETIWSEEIRYPFWEAHAVRATDDHVELEAASRQGVGRHYVTVHLVAEKARIPAQRQAHPVSARVGSSGDTGRRQRARPRHLRLTP
jgi:hypothetical protein